MNKEPLKFISIFIIMFLLLGFITPTAVFANPSEPEITDGNGRTAEDAKQNEEDLDSNKGYTFDDFEFKVNTSGSNVMSIGSSDESVTFESSANRVYNKFHVFLVGLSGFATLTVFLLFLRQLLSMMTLPSNNPQKRREMLTGLLTTGVGTSLLGSLTLIAGIAFNFL